MSPNTLTGGGTEQRGGDKKILKMGGGHAGSRGGCLKKGGGLEPLTNYEYIKYVSQSPEFQNSVYFLSGTLCQTIRQTVRCNLIYKFFIYTNQF